MIINKFEKPWPHYEINNFCSNKEFLLLKTYALNFIENNPSEIKKYNRLLHNLDNECNEFLILKKNF